MKPETIIKNNKMIAEFMGLKIITDGISCFDTNYKAVKDYHKSYDALVPVFEKMIQPLRVKIYGAYRDINGEEVSMHVVKHWWTQSYVSFKIEYGRRFKEFTEYKENKDIGMINPMYRVVVNFIKWYNNHKIEK